MVALVGSFALLVTVHVALAAGLLLRSPRWRAPIAFLVPPLAPYWGMQEGMRVRTALWLSALGVYILARVTAGL
jgi:hypothetical protein